MAFFQNVTKNLNLGPLSISCFVFCSLFLISTFQLASNFLDALLTAIIAVILFALIFLDLVKKRINFFYGSVLIVLSALSFTYALFSSDGETLLVAIFYFWPYFLLIIAAIFLAFSKGGTSLFYAAFIYEFFGQILNFLFNSLKAIQDYNTPPSYISPLEQAGLVFMGIGVQFTIQKITKAGQSILAFKNLFLSLFVLIFVFAIGLGLNKANNPRTGVVQGDYDETITAEGMLGTNVDLKNDSKVDLTVTVTSGNPVDIFLMSASQFEENKPISSDSLNFKMKLIPAFSVEKVSSFTKSLQLERGFYHLFIRSNRSYKKESSKIHYTVFVHSNN